MWQSPMKKKLHHILLFYFKNSGWLYKEDEVSVKPNMFFGNPTHIQMNDFIPAGRDKEYVNNIN